MTVVVAGKALPPRVQERQPCGKQVAVLLPISCNSSRIRPSAVKSEEATPGGACRLRTGRGGWPLRLCLPCRGMLDEPLGGTPHAHAGDRYRDRLPGLHRRLRRNGADRDLLAQRLEVEARPAEILRRRKSACRRDRRPIGPKQPEAVEPSAAGRVWLRSGSIQRCGSTACSPFAPCVRRGPLPALPYRGEPGC